MKLDQQTVRDIEIENTKILKDIGFKCPPVNAENILEHLNLDRRYFDLEDPNLFERFWHKVKTQKHRLTHLLGKVNLVAMWFPVESQIYIDSKLPGPKQKWATHHEIQHGIIPWHRDFYMGDTAQTLEPYYQESLEAEANYGTSYLMFGGDFFRQEALDTKPEWESIDFLRKRYCNSYVTTLRRYVQDRHDIPMAAFISTPHWLEKPNNQENRWRHFDSSDKFKERFGDIHPGILLSQVDLNTNKRRGGLIGDFSLTLKDINGNWHEFRAESFFNKYNILTFIVYKKQLVASSIIY